jgi:solute carrier family 25 (mitochondrial adenine nucleotide translocator), member 4/5/6/31
MAAEDKYKGIGDCFSKVYKERGFDYFWRGNLANVIWYFAAQAMNFAFKDHFKKWFCQFNLKQQPFMFFLGNMASGGAAGATTLLFMYPLDIARARRARFLADVDKGKREGKVREFSSLIDCLSKIYKADGLIGLYRGFALSVTGTIIFRASYFGIFDTGKTILFPDAKRASFLAMWAFAQLVSVTASIASYPIDTVRRRLIIQSEMGLILYSGALDCFKKIY